MEARTKLQRYQATWQRKPILQKIYRRWYAKIFNKIRGGGAVLELGSGSGMGREFRRDTILGDVVFNHWLDLVLDGEQLPLRGGSLSAIIMIDTLHHLRNPVLFLKEANRVLAVGGRIIAIEPYAGKLAYYFWSYLHHEPVKVAFDVLEESPHGKDPFDSNQAIPYLLSKHFHRIKPVVPEISLIDVEFFDLFYYALSGGFSKPNLIPCFLESVFLRIDKLLLSIFGKYLSLRMMLVFEKVA